MIGVEYHGRFGNNIIQYALGRIIHEKTGRQLETWNGNRDLKEHHGIDIKMGEPRFHGQEYFPQCPSFIPGERLSSPVTIREHDYRDVDEMISMASGRGMILHGFFQRSKYFLDWRDRIREWFHLPRMRLPDGAWIVHSRRADYLKNSQELPLSYYEEALAKIPDGAPVTYIGDDTDFLMRLNSIRAGDIFKGSGISDFQLMASHDNIIGSNSTFFWCAAFLSHAKRVIMPRPQSGKYWSADSDQQLYVPGWEVLEC